MSDATKAAELPDRFIEMVDSMYTPLELTLFNRRGIDSWDMFKLRDGSWDFEDNVGDTAAFAVFTSGQIYARIDK